MKLKAILKEDGAVLTFRDLNSMQIALIKKLAKGEIDYENLSPNAWAVINSLQDLDLVDQQLNLTQKGVRASEIASKVGGTDLRRAGVRDRMLGRTGGQPQRYTDTDDGEDATSTEPGAFQDQWGSVRDRDD